MWKKAILVALAAIIGAGILAWFNRSTILTHLVLERVKSMHYPVAEHEAVVWQQGPSTPSEAAAEQPPNIVFILLDDLGINDLSTFGGGVADGRVPTPNIDRLAAEGAIFTQAYSGTGTCAPSRAMCPFSNG